MVLLFWHLSYLLSKMKYSLLPLALLLMAAGPNSPDLSLTPGVATNLTKEQVCTKVWGKDVRHVTESMKRQVFHAYGFAHGNKDPRCPCEIDHLISRELGGADDVRNLFPQSYTGPWNARMKDRLENRLHREVCKGSISLQDAQKAIVDDWQAAYRKYFGDAP